MIVNRDYFDNPIIPDYVLCKASRERIGVINSSKKTAEIKFNDLNEISFTTYMNIDNERNPYYEAVDIMKYILLPEIGFYAITSCDIQSEGTEFEYKDVTAKSYECLMGQKYLETFIINMGTDGSVDGVRLYNPDDTEHSLLHLILSKCPDWTIGHIDIGLAEMQRSFEVDRQDVYSFIMEDVATAFECVFIFDTLNCVINIYKEANYGIDTDIHVSYNNLLKNTNISCSIDDIKTCLIVSGADDINIREVNMGYDRIYNFDYFNSLEYMSKSLYDSYITWRNKWNKKKEEYKKWSEEYQKSYKQLNELKYLMVPSSDGNRHIGYGTFSRFELGKEIGTVNFEKHENVQVLDYDITSTTKPDNPAENILYIVSADGVYNMYRYIKDTDEFFNVNDWTGYSYNYLTEKLSAYQKVQTTYASSGWGEPDNEYYSSLYLPLRNTIKALENEINEVAGGIEALTGYMAIIGFGNGYINGKMEDIVQDVAIENNFTQEQLKELSTFIREDELNGDNFVITDIMSEDERYETLNELLSFGEEELMKVSTPQLSFSTDMANIFAIPEFSKLYGQFEVGNYIWTTLRDDYHVKTRLLNMHLNFYDPTDFSVEFNNVVRKAKTRYTDVAEMIKAGASAATSVSFNSSYWTQAAKDSSEINQKLSDGLLSSGTVISGSTESSELIIDTRGVFVNSGKESEHPNDSIFLGSGRILYSDDDWETVRMAIGRSTIKKSDGTTSSKFGVFADFCIASYIEGATIVGGEIFSENYEKGKNGSYINLENGTFEFNGNGQSKFVFEKNEDDEYILTVRGNIIADSGSFGSIEYINESGVTVTQGSLGGDSRFTSTAENPFGEDVESNTAVQQIKEIALNAISDDYITTEEFEEAIKDIKSGEENVQSDWSETDNTSDAYILNKPTTLSGYGITDAATSTALSDEITRATTKEDELQDAISDKADSDHTHTNASTGQGYGICSTAAATTAKVVTLSNYVLTTDGIVAVKFTYGVPAGATMNINSKGAKPIYYRGSAIQAGIIEAGDIATFIYNGSYYILLSIDKEHLTIDVVNDSTSTETPSCGDTITMIDSIERDNNGHTLSINTKTITLPSNSDTANALTTARTIDGVSFDGSSSIVHYGACNTAAATTAKTVVCSGFKLVTGARILVKFTTNNTEQYPTLNVNSTGEKKIYYRGIQYNLSTYFKVNEIYEFVYTGSYWEIVGGITDSSVEWKKFGVVSGTATSILFPDTNVLTISEILIESSFGSYSVFGTINIPHNSLFGNVTKYYRTGYYQSNTACGMVNFSCTSGGISLTSAYINGVDVTNDVTWTVYYR